MNLPHRSDPLCDCHCAVHHGTPRHSYDLESCGCLLTCATQPMTLVVKEWRCALFNHASSGRLWFVMSAGPAAWDWGTANEIDDRADVFEAGTTIETFLHEIESVIERSEKGTFP